VNLLVTNRLGAIVQQHALPEGGVLRIGRTTTNDVVLDSPVVPELAGLLDRDEAGWGFRAQAGQTLQLLPFYLKFEEDRSALAREEWAESWAELLRSVHDRLLPRLDATDLDTDLDAERLRGVEEKIRQELEAVGFASVGRDGLRRWVAGECVCETLAASLKGPSAGERPWRRPALTQPLAEHALQQWLGDLARDLGLENLTYLGDLLQRLQQGFVAWWARRRADGREVHAVAVRHAVNQIKDILYGYGPLEELLAWPSVTEIMVNSASRIFIEANGRLLDSGRRFTSDQAALWTIQRIVGQVHRQIDRSRPLVDARLDNGDRVNAVIAPITLDGPALTIRRFPVRRLTLADLMARGALSAGAAEFLRSAVVARLNVLVSGGTGSGKTTLLNCLADFIPAGERTITLEDTAELRLGHAHVVRLETRQANSEGTGAYPMRALVANALRMRPNRIVVGECRGPEALDMLQAMNTGHDGSLTTLHANSPDDALSRLETMVLSAGMDLPSRAIREQACSAIHLIVQVEQHGDGVRRLSGINEVAGIDPRSGRVRTRAVFGRPDRMGFPLLPTGCIPACLDRLRGEGGLRVENLFLE
jgi:pilus assembly protein CpaF